MDGALVGLFGAMGSVAFFAFISFSVWVDYRKKKDERDATHQERMRALELGYPPLEAEIERARAYASAAWAAGLIGLLVPLALVSLTVLGTIVVVLTSQTRENLAVPLIVAWSIVAVLMLVPIVRSLNVIRELPRPTADTPPRIAALGKQASAPSTEFQVKRSES
jgi:hypothetical protein